MKWSFIISYLDGIYLEPIVNSIKNQNNLTKDNFEIILIGPDNEALHKIKPLINNNIVFNETLIPGWITMKKNLGIQNANFENVCIMHDYIGLCENWYTGYLRFGDNWEVCSNSIRRLNGTRYRDWITLDRPVQFISYDDNTHTNTNMYVDGTQWCAKRKFMVENPLDIRRVWGQGEDIEWSVRCKNKWIYKFNAHSIMTLLKDKGDSDLTPHPELDMNLSEFYRNAKLQK